MLLVLALCGCESADEKAERLRLENLYALDDLKVAQAYKKADLPARPMPRNIWKSNASAPRRK